MQTLESQNFPISDVWDLTTQVKRSRVLKSEIIQHLNKSTRFAGIECLKLYIPCVMGLIVTPRCIEVLSTSECDRSLGRRLPASCRQLPRPPGGTSCPAQPAGEAEGLEPMESACPSLLCLLVLPSLHSMLSFFWFIRPWGEPGPARLPAEHPWEAASWEQTSRLWGRRLSHPLPPPDPGQADSPSPSLGEATQFLGPQSLPFRGSKTEGCLGYTEAPLLTLGGGN